MPPPPSALPSGVGVVTPTAAFSHASNPPVEVAKEDMALPRLSRAAVNAAPGGVSSVSSSVSLPVATRSLT